MIHLVFARPQRNLKVFHSDKSLKFVYEASGDACASSNGPMPEGHYVLLQPEMFPQSTWDDSKDSMGVGWGRIRVRDMTSNDEILLMNAGIALKNSDGSLNIGGISLPPGSCDSYNRAIEMHGGGSALGFSGAYLANQRLCCTLGCTRMHNQDIGQLIGYMGPLLNGNTFILSAIGAPTPCDC